MAFGFPAYHEDTRQYPASQAELSQALRQSLSQLRWKHVTYASADFWSVPESLASFGERVYVKLNADGCVTARSECIWPLQCLDHGKNRRNVRRLFAELEGSLFTRTLKSFRQHLS
jgi:hypothetical protein